MDAELIFNQVAATRLLEQLAATEPALFVCDQEMARLLKEYFGTRSPANHTCVVWQPELMTAEFVEPYSVIVAASLFQEQAIFEAMQEVVSLPVRRLFADVFTNLIAERPLFASVEESLEAPQQSYAIVTTPRSGSTYLCELLRATGRAGYPTEHLRQISMTLAKNCGFDYLKFLKAQMTYQRTDNGIFGTKFISHFLFDLQDCPSNSSFDLIFKEYISKFVYLVREDKLAQAVSAFVAKKTKVWHIFRDEKQQAYNQQTRILEVNETDLEDLHRIHRSFFNQEAQLERLLENYQIEPLIIKYEELANRPETELKILLEYLGIPLDGLDLSNLKTQSKRLQSEFSQTLIEKYHQKYGGLTHHGLAL